MGESAHVRLFYGVTLHPDAVPPYCEGDRKEGPAWMAYSGKDEGEVCIFVTGHHDVPRLAIALRRTVQRGMDWAAMPVPALLRQEHSNECPVEAFLARYGLEAAVDMGPPQWLVAPYYG